jgi:delta 1-pyrroline-5-carboxylate dehydrogenase
VNGWELPLLDKVVRRCKEETPNLAAFVQKFADRHVAIVDLAQSQVSAVRCIGQ